MRTGERPLPLPSLGCHTYYGLSTTFIGREEMSCIALGRTHRSPCELEVLPRLVVVSIALLAFMLVIPSLCPLLFPIDRYVPFSCYDSFMLVRTTLCLSFSRSIMRFARESLQDSQRDRPYVLETRPFSLLPSYSKESANVSPCFYHCREELAEA